MGEKAMKKVIMWKLLSCLVVIAILLSSMSVSIVAMNDNNASNSV